MSMKNLTAEQAIALIDPHLVGGLPHDAVQELLNVGLGTPHRSVCDLSEDQLDLIRKHRVLPLVPREWTNDIRCDKERVRLAGLKLALERSWNELSDALGDYAEQTRLLKGMATGALDYPQPGLRHTGDIDLLVPPELLGSIAKELVTAGYKTPEFLDSRRLPMEKGFPLVDRHGLEIDLHTRLLWKRSTGHPSIFDNPTKIESIGALAMPEELRLVHAAIHLIASAPGSRRLSGCADIVVLMANLPNLLTVRRAAEKLDVVGLCGAGLRIAVLAAGLDLHEAELDRFPDASRLQTVAFLRGSRLGVLDRFARIADLPDLSQKSTYTSSVLFPQKATRKAHGGWLKHASRAFRGR